MKIEKINKIKNKKRTYILAVMVLAFGLLAGCGGEDAESRAREAESRAEEAESRAREAESRAKLGG